jgi:hypothetical protein
MTDDDFKRVRERENATYERWRYDEEMYWRREVLVLQLVDIYRRLPHAASQLLGLATETLDDPLVIAELMNRLKEKGGMQDEPKK